MTDIVETAGGTESTDAPRSGVEARILEATREILARDGIEALSMRGVAARVDLSATALYHYFENKRELVDRVVEGSFRRIESYLLDAAKGTPEGSLDRLRALAEGYIRFAREEEVYFRVLFAIQTERLREIEDHPAEGCYRLMHRSVTEAIRRGEILPVDPDVVVLQLWAFVHGIVTLSLSCRLEVPPGGRQVEARDLLRASWDQVVDGLRPRGEPAGGGPVLHAAADGGARGSPDGGTRA